MKKSKSFLVILALVMAFAFAACESNDGKTVVNTSAGEVVTYGAYAQDVVTDATLISQLEAASWSNDKATVGMTSYARVRSAQPYREGATFNDGTPIVEGQTYYFSIQPIEWYTVNYDSNGTMLLAKDILDVAAFSTNTETDNNGNYPNNWELCSLSAWLNGGFYEAAFTAIEASAINTTKVVSTYPQSFYKAHTIAIKDAWNKVYCLSYSEATSNCFTPDGDSYDFMRMAQASDYARAKGIWFYMSDAKEGDADYERESYFDGNGEYWLRTVGQDIVYAGIARYNGMVGPQYKYVNTTNVGVRPAMTVGIQL